MDKQTTLGFVLIAAVLMVWMWYTSPKPQPQQQKQTTEKIAGDSAQQAQSPKIERAIVQAPAPQTANIESNLYGKYFSGRENGKEKFITIETDDYTAVISSKGAVIKKWEMKQYKTWDKEHQVQLVSDSTSGDFSLLFTTTDGKLINTKDLYFDFSSAAFGKVKLSGNDEYVLEAVLRSAEGKIVKKLTFKNGKNDFAADIAFVGMQNVIANYEYQIVWENTLRYQEANSVDESYAAAAYAYAGGELAEIDAASADEVPTLNSTGSTDWVAMRNKYFAVAMISNDKKASGAYIEGHHIAAANGGIVEKYAIALKMPFKNSNNEQTSLTVFFGPLEISLLKEYNTSLEQIMSLGWSWIRPLTVYMFIPLMKFLNSFIPNWGIVLIVFSLIIKLALHPLTKSSMNSMRKMQKLQPLMTEIREKYKNDSSTMNMKVMELYKEYGVNPAGGCLPLVLQMPILFALYALFTHAIELRQSSFMLWITDLSRPDVLVQFPFSLPLIGNHLSGLTLAMGITMYFQQKQTITDPNQKMLIWMMPIMMTIMFNFFPAGLNLYYFTFNLLSIGQQYYFNHRHKDEPLQKVPQNKRKGGILASLSKNLPKPPKK